MATSKVVTVTAASVGTGDTLASYNIYSDQDGLLDNASVAEATAGHTVSLSDGVVHSVTVKPVGTSSGEYNAPSNAVTVDLSAPSEINITPLFNIPGEWTITGTNYINNGATSPNYGVYNTLISGDFEIKRDV